MNSKLQIKLNLGEYNQILAEKVDLDCATEINNHLENWTEEQLKCPKEEEELYGATSFLHVLKSSEAIANVQKPATHHRLRQSCSNHLLVSLTDLRYIQDLLVHMTSYMIKPYTYVREKGIQPIKCPFNDL